MANYVENDLYVEGPKKDVKALLKLIGADLPKPEFNFGDLIAYCVARRDYNGNVCITFLNKTEPEVETIRGVNCDYAVQKLLEKGLIEIQGKGETVGRPLIYGTSPKFMEYFGINELSELPTPKDFSQEINTIGEGPENQ